MGKSYEDKKILENPILISKFLDVSPELRNNNKEVADQLKNITVLFEKEQNTAEYGKFKGQMWDALCRAGYAPDENQKVDLNQVLEKAIEGIRMKLAQEPLKNKQEDLEIKPTLKR